ncbi:MAG: HD-GYP domain-containing protein [bacterium]
MTEFSAAISRKLGIPEEDIEKIKLAGMLHDIGKIGVREGILNKAGPLTEEEFAHIKAHPIVGERILKPIVKDGWIIESIRHHHERFDGGGYPDGLRGEEIPLGARILAVADTLDAMTSTRSYRDRLPFNAAKDEISKCAGTQLDPQMVDAFLKLPPETLGIS